MGTPRAKQLFRPRIVVPFWLHFRAIWHLFLRSGASEIAVWLEESSLFSPAVCYIFFMLSAEIAIWLEESSLLHTLACRLRETSCCCCCFLFVVLVIVVQCSIVSRSLNAKLSKSEDSSSQTAVESLNVFCCLKAEVSKSEDSSSQTAISADNRNKI